MTTSQVALWSRVQIQVIWKRFLLVYQLHWLCSARALSSQEIVVHKVVDLAVVIDYLECLKFHIQIENVFFQLKVYYFLIITKTYLSISLLTTESMVNCSTKSSFSYLVSMSKWWKPNLASIEGSNVFSSVTFELNFPEICGWKFWY